MTALTLLFCQFNPRSLNQGKNLHKLFVNTMLTSSQRWSGVNARKLRIIFFWGLTTLFGIINFIDVSSQPSFTETKVDVDHSEKRMNNVTVDLNNCVYATVPNDLFIPVFVMTRDRVSSLKIALDSYYQTFESPFEIIILDHFSTYPPMLAYLEQLRHTNVTVVSLTKNDWGNALGEANAIIQNYLSEHPFVEYYVVTDPDIAFLRSMPNALLFYAGLLKSCPEVRVVGPALLISDIPAENTKTWRGKSPYDWEKQYWTAVPNTVTWNGVGYHVTSAKIDTTFAMRRRNLPFGRLQMPSLRAYAPYAANHVDWYFDSTNLPPDKVHYLQRQQQGVNSWRR